MRTRDILPIADDFDGVDVKGWALGWLFPIAETLYVAGERIPESWEFSPSPMLTGMSLDEFRLDHDEWQAEEVVFALRLYGADAVRYVGNVLSRYVELFVRGTDRDY